MERLEPNRERQTREAVAGKAVAVPLDEADRNPRVVRGGVAPVECLAAVAVECLAVVAAWPI